MLPRFATTILWLILLLGAIAGAPLRARSEGGPIEADAQGKAKFRQEQDRPIKLGTSGGSVRDRTLFSDSTSCCSGTLGGLVEKNGKLYVLSNNHVIARANRGNRGEAIIQPGYLDQTPICQVPSEDETIAHLRAWKRLKFGGVRKNRVDAAIAEVVTGEVDPSGKILNIGIPGTTPVDPAIGMEVKKSGRTTGLTRGIIFAVDVDANVTFEQGCGTENNKTARFVKQFAIVGTNRDFSKEGDSGSMVYRNVANCPAPVGLIFAGSDTISVANPIKTVVKQLSRRPPRGDIEFVGCTQAESESDDFDLEATSSQHLQTTSQDASLLLMNDPEVKFAQRVLARQKNRLLRSSHVFGVGLGLATTGAADPVVNIFVDRDRPDSWSELPSSLEGVRTEIVPTGPFVASCAASVFPSAAGD